MTIQEIIKEKNLENLGEYKLVKGWVYKKENWEKRFSCYEKESLFVQDYQNMKRINNARKNSYKMMQHLSELGLVKYSHSTTSSYYDTVKGTVRVSDHEWTSEKHVTPSLNLCSYKENGFEQMIANFNKFIN